MTVLKCLFCFLFFLMYFFGVGTLSGQDTEMENSDLSMTLLEEKLLSVELDMINSKKKMENSQNYINLLEKQQNKSLELLNQEKQTLKEESERYERLLKLYEQLSQEIAKLKQSGTVKNWIIGGLAVSTILAFLIGLLVGKSQIK